MQTVCWWKFVCTKWRNLFHRFTSIDHVWSFLLGLKLRCAMWGYVGKGIHILTIINVSKKIVRLFPRNSLHRYFSINKKFLGAWKIRLSFCITHAHQLPLWSSDLNTTMQNMNISWKWRKGKAVQNRKIMYTTLRRDDGIKRKAQLWKSIHVVSSNLKVMMYNVQQKAAKEIKWMKHWIMWKI